MEGKCKIGLESTIVSLLDEPTILRYGGLDILKIKKVLNKKVLVKTTSEKENCTWTISSALLSWYSIKNKRHKT
jgi:hypothetical protein